MDITQLLAYIDECYKLLNSENVISDREAQFRAGRFLEAQFHITKGIRMLASDQLKSKSLNEMTYTSLLNSDGSKNVTEKKANAEANPNFISVRERFDEIEADIKNLYSLLKVFQDAHVFYRQLAKGDPSYALKV